MAQNLQISLNMTMLAKFVKAHPEKVTKAKDGNIYITVFCNTRKKVGINNETHFVSVGKIDGEYLFVGNAKPAKYQRGGKVRKDKKTTHKTNKTKWSKRTADKAETIQRDSQQTQQSTTSVKDPWFS